MSTIKSDIYECSNCHLIFAVPITSKKDINCPECNQLCTCVASGEIVITAEH
jgi:uncharacterized paraquat-inducible protein A